MSLVRAEIIITDFPSHSFTRPTIEESSSKLQWDSKAEKSRNLARVLKAKENNKYENQIKVL